MNDEIKKLINKHKEYNHNCDVERIMKAWEFALSAHAGQKRLTGEDFIYHPLAVANTLCYWKLDEDSVIAALLHDTIEDGAATREDIVNEFGESVATLVDGVTKVTNIRLRGSSEEQFVETLRKMILVMAKDIRVVLLKLADRLHNMRTLAPLSKERQLSNSKETLEIYAPLAERLGMGEIKGVLQDLAFPYVYPEEYKEVVKNSQKYYEHAERTINKMQKTLLREFKKEGLKDVEVKGRKKHYYSLWKKLQRSSVHGDFEKIHDIVAFRVLVNNVRQCYETLGIVHANFKPVPKMTLSDFIAQPKSNGYQSLHTKVFANGSGIVEVQIRTHKMHAEAEHGAAAHWAYSENKSEDTKELDLEKKGGVIDSKKGWVKQLVNWHKEISDSKKFMEVVKLDAFRSRILVFSPKGDVYDLPEGSTPVDYAYAVHSGLAKHLDSVLVNGLIVSLDYQLQNGDIVHIKKSKLPKGPYKDWLKHSVTTKARNGIRKQLRLV